MKYNIILPARYEQSSDRYPVLYLLHGFSSNYTAWARMGVPEYARPFDLIVVMPDVGNSWYVNWAKSDDGQMNQWEDFIIKDLIGHVDATYRTIARREGRAINGLSMGGYGGLTLGLRHAELFCSIGSHSGAVAFARTYGEQLKAGRPQRARRPPSTTPDPRIGVEGFSSQAERSPKGKIFTTAEECAAYDPFQLVLQVRREKLPHIYLDCGTEERLVKFRYPVHLFPPKSFTATPLLARPGNHLCPLYPVAERIECAPSRAGNTHAYLRNRRECGIGLCLHP